MVRLRGLEQVTKATMLGHLLPVLLTSLMHPNLQTLTLADALMPQLVQLVLYTSQVCATKTLTITKGGTAFCVTLQKYNKYNHVVVCKVLCYVS